MKNHPFASSLLFGLIAGYIVGFSRTGKTALHLLEKNKALKEAGQIPLPGDGHWETMASVKPALFGGLFYAVALGAGAAAIGFAFGLFLRFFGPTVRRYGQIAALVPPFWAFWNGDAGLGIALGVVLFFSMRHGLSGERLKLKDAAEPVLATLILAISLAPAVISESGGFILARNAMVKVPPLRAVSDFYYRWTLYPAESIKPILALSQPLAGISLEMTEEKADRAAAEIGSLGAITLPGAAGSDFQFVEKNGEVFVTMNGKEQKWPEESVQAQVEALKTLSRAADSARPARNSMLVGLVGGFPLLLLLVYYRVGAWLFSASVRRRAIFFTAFSIAVFALSVAGDKNYLYVEKAASLEEVLAAMSSEDPAMRLYAARGAGRFAGELEDNLIFALEDPVLNVRYSAAHSLGKAGTEKARAKLIDIVSNEGDWYTKDRAWWALRGN